mmetsp:Transcript_5428/g.8007  ORF Transcript_5428/g.8007 Transcript_5428/m.8007 type:complete len:577 (+) Transcript_5428:79-1809(+)
MGIQGLLPMVKPICKSVHVKEYSGKRMAVDGYVWLHRGAYSCAKEIVQRIRTEKFINYGLSMAKMLQYYNITPVLVFDGARLPAKSGKEKERHDRRKKAREKAIRLQNQGYLGEAHECYKKAVDISPALAFQFITKLREAQVECIVAPYEADAQLAYLERSGYVDGVITEDSDLIPYGATCVLFKLEKNGNAIEYKQSFLVQSKEYDFFRMTPNDIIRMCVLSGCDYLDSLPGIGIKKAYKLVREYQTIERILAHLSRQSIHIPEEYQQEFEKAYLTFKYQTVWCPLEETLRPLEKGMHEEPHQQGDHLDFLGAMKDPDIGKAIAECIIDPMTHESFLQNVKRIPTRSRARATFSIETPTQKNKITSYASSLKKKSTTTPQPLTPNNKTPRKTKKKKKLFKSRFFSALNNSQQDMTIQSQEKVEKPVIIQEKVEKPVIIQEKVDNLPVLPIKVDSPTHLKKGQETTNKIKFPKLDDEDTTPNMFQSLSYQHYAAKTPEEGSIDKSYASQDLLEMISVSKTSSYVRKRKQKRSLFEYFGADKPSKIKKTNMSRFFSSSNRPPPPPPRSDNNDVIVID